MSTATLLKKMGYAESDRLVILHADDVGMCQATLTAFADLWDCGGVSSGAVMSPCPWFQGLADYIKNHADVDMGIHATLNCEWQHYRWGAVSTCDPNSGLLDKDGFLHMATQDTVQNATPAEVSAELTAQINKVSKAGIDFSHIDSHMGTILSGSFIEDYVMQAIANKVPAMLPRINALGVTSLGGRRELMEKLAPKLDELDDQGFPLIDGIMMMPLDQPHGQLEIAKQMLSQLPVGITHFIYHPAVDTPELRSICPDWPSRVANYHTFMNEDIQTFLNKEGIQVVGYKALRNAMRG